ncbi:MAG TPA: hypothetical protein VK964_16825 [Nocardioidaceae bacterium]|nr:hypothetical protein [Nocardioidaceae bacterium]
MTTQHIVTLIIGAGRAGLATGYHLQRFDRPFLIVDGNEQIGDNWQQWTVCSSTRLPSTTGRLGAPYDTACARLLIGRALGDLGDEHSAANELSAARRTFRELGALPAEAEAARTLSPALPGGLTEREASLHATASACELADLAPRGSAARSSDRGAYTVPLGVAAR